MKRIAILLAVLFLADCRASADGADNRGEGDQVRPFEWSVFLDGWQLLGPFPKAEADPAGLDTPFVNDEAGLRAGRVTFYDRKLYTWRSYAGRTIEFRNALGVPNAAGNNKVAYALTQFSSPVTQKARLAFGYDDQFVAWLNGKEVARGTDEMWSSLDQEVVEVDLQAGANVLLLKVANGVKGWEGFARLLPAEPAMPLLKFRTQSTNNGLKLPVIDVELLDADRQRIAQHRCSGSRHADSYSAARYALYVGKPDTEPAFARFKVLEPGFSADEVIFPWGRLLTGKATVPLMADRPLQLVVINAKTRQPIEGATVWVGGDRERPVTDGQGRISLPEFSPLTSRCFVAAARFAAKTVDLKFPRRGVQRVELTPGGRTVVGTVVSTGGEPIEGATITSGVSGGYSPAAVTDEAGKFELVSLPESRTQIYPVIEAPGYVGKGRFSLEVNHPETSVRWELTPGATIVGRIVDKASDEPVGGVTITTGDDRFGSNNPKATVTSKPDGTYELTGVAAGESLVHAFSDDYAPAMQRVTTAVGVPVNLDFEVTAGRPVAGVIHDGDGNPVPDVRLITDTWNGARMFAREARTDAAGNFVLSHMPDSAAEVHVLKRGFISRRDVMVTGGDTVELTLLPTFVHTIAIRDAAEGRIVPELQISKGYLWEGNSDWYWQSSEHETDRYYDKLKGEMRIEINEQSSTYEIAYRFRAAGFEEEIVKLPRDLSAGKSFDVRLRTAEVFEGRVVDALSGQPLEGVIVAAVSREDRLRADQNSNFQTPWQFVQSNRSTAVKSTTDSDGLFRLSAQNAQAEGAGLALLSADGGFHFVEGSLLTNSEDAETKLLELPMPASASLSGQLTIAGKPVAGANVRIQWLGHGQATQDDWNRGFGVGGQVATDRDGRFSFARLGPGTYQLNRVFRIPLGDNVSSTAYLDIENVVLLPGEDVEHNLVRPAGLTLAGTAKTIDGKPVAGCVVYAAKSDEPNVRIEAVIADSTGRFSLEHLLPGSYQVSAELQVRQPEGYYSMGFSGSTSVTLNDERDNVEITLAKINRNQTQPVATKLTGTLAPEFSVTPLGSDTPIVLSKQYGKVTVVCFWSAADQNVAVLNAVFRKFQSNADVVLVPVFQQGAAMLELQRKQFSEQPEFPLIAGDEIYAPPLFHLFSGNRGISACYVTGRDGRFAAEPVSLLQLGTAIDRALAQTPDETLAIDQAATLNVTLSSDKSERGIPGAKLLLRAVDSEGKTVREDTCETGGTPRDIRWRYPALSDGGKLLVELSGQGIGKQERTVDNPSGTESITFDNASPRRITGTVVNLATQQSEPDVVVQLRDGFGQVMTGRSDSSGKIDVPCYSGTFSVVSPDNDRFAVSTSPPQTVTVGQTSDPAPIEIRIAPATTVKGRVVDPSNEPVAGAVVMTQGGGYTLADEVGWFELPGIPTVGTTQLWASTSQQAYGVIGVEGPLPDKEVTIRIGAGLDGKTVLQSALVSGQQVPTLDVTALDGKAVTWQAASENGRLVVIGALWHPATKVLIAKARTWCEDNGKPLQVLSLDWNLEQARRESEALALATETVFAGPGTLALSEGWSLTSERTAVLVAKDGTVVSLPLE